MSGRGSDGLRHHDREHATPAPDARWSGRCCSVSVRNGIRYSRHPAVPSTFPRLSRTSETCPRHARSSAGPRSGTRSAENPRCRRTPASDVQQEIAVQILAVERAVAPAATGPEIAERELATTQSPVARRCRGRTCRLRSSRCRDSTMPVRDAVGEDPSSSCSWAFHARVNGSRSESSRPVPGLTDALKYVVSPFCTRQRVRGRSPPPPRTPSRSR